MAAFVIVHATPKNAEKMQQYGAGAGPTLAEFGGEFLGRGTNEDLHGENGYAMSVLLSFPDADAARRWYNSDAYQALIPVRSEAMDCEFTLVAGE